VAISDSENFSHGAINASFTIVVSVRMIIPACGETFIPQASQLPQK
jgi:hypothetical protein